MAITKVGFEHSNNIDNIEYDEEKGVLHVTFTSGKTYAYFGVPLDVFTAFIESDRQDAVLTPGKFFNKNIKPHYHCEKIEEAKA